MIRLFMILTIALTIGAPVYFFAPPLSTGKIEWTPAQRAALNFSEPAVAGMTAFGQNCAGCHGELADGSAGAPALTNRSYAVDFRDAAAFHTDFSQDIPAHRDVIAATRNTGRLGFNELELMSKFLREARQYHTRKAREG